MCIRDSQQPGYRDRRTGGEHGSGRHRLHPGTGHDDRQSRPCLLYTSDAADERSSVDLGGRRIIKKKNNGEPR